MSKFDNIDVDKLVFKQQYQEAGRITVVANNKNRYPVSRESILAGIKQGAHHHRINTFFTPESIKAATKVAEAKTKQKSEKKDGSKD